MRDGYKNLYKKDTDVYRDLYKKDTKRVITKSIRETTSRGDFTVERSRCSSGRAYIRIIKNDEPKFEIWFGNDSIMDNKYGDEYEVAAKELAQILESICDDPCNLPEK